MKLTKEQINILNGLYNALIKSAISGNKVMLHPKLVNPLIHALEPIITEYCAKDCITGK